MIFKKIAPILTYTSYILTSEYKSVFLSYYGIKLLEVELIVRFGTVQDVGVVHHFC